MYHRNYPLFFCYFLEVLMLFRILNVFRDWFSPSRSVVQEWLVLRNNSTFHTIMSSRLQCYRPLFILPLTQRTRGVDCSAVKNMSSRNGIKLCSVTQWTKLIKGKVLLNVLLLVYKGSSSKWTPSDQHVCKVRLTKIPSILV